MKPIDKMPLWEVNSRTNELQDFRKTTWRFFELIHYGSDETAHEIPKLRQQINLVLPHIHESVQLAGVNSLYTITGAVIHGGRNYPTDILENIFDIDTYGLSPAHVFDVLDRALGEYKRIHRSAVIRTINVFSWLALGVNWIASLPFKLLGSAGYDQSKIEGHWLGKAFKSVFNVGTWAGLITVIEKLGYLNELKNFLHGLSR